MCTASGSCYNIHGQELHPEEYIALSTPSTGSSLSGVTAGASAAANRYTIVVTVFWRFLKASEFCNAGSLPATTTAPASGAMTVRVSPK